MNIIVVTLRELHTSELNTTYHTGMLMSVVSNSYMNQRGPSYVTFLRSSETSGNQRGPSYVAFLRSSETSGNPWSNYSAAIQLHTQATKFPLKSPVSMLDAQMLRRSDGGMLTPLEHSSSAGPV